MSNDFQGRKKKKRRQEEPVSQPVRPSLAEALNDEVAGAEELLLSENAVPEATESVVVDEVVEQATDEPEQVVEPEVVDVPTEEENEYIDSSDEMTDEADELSTATPEECELALRLQAVRDFGMIDAECFRNVVGLQHDPMRALYLLEFYTTQGFLEQQWLKGSYYWTLTSLGLRRLEDLLTRV